MGQRQKNWEKKHW